MSSMGNFLSKLYHSVLNSSRKQFVIFICSVFCLFAPKNYLEYLDLLNFIIKYKPYISSAFLISCVLLFTNTMIYLKSKFYKLKIKSEIRSYLASLTYYEKAVLREFYIQKKSTLNLPSTNEDVVSLESKLIIYKCSDFGSVTYNNYILYPYRINGYAFKNISKSMIDIPDNPSDEEIAELRRRRPNFVTQIPEL